MKSEVTGEVTSEVTASPPPPATSGAVVWLSAASSTGGVGLMRLISSSGSVSALSTSSPVKICEPTRVIG